MTDFSLPIPEKLNGYLNELDIYNDKELIGFFEEHIPLFSPIEFGWFLFKDIKMRYLFYIYQQLINKGEKPLLMHFTANIQKKFLTSGILDYKQLKEYALISSIERLTNKQSVYYHFVRELIRDEVAALDNFYDHFGTRATNALRSYDITNFYDLKVFINDTNLFNRIGVKTKQKILAVWEREFLKL
jgi:hypothetical protein